MKKFFFVVIIFVIIAFGMVAGFGLVSQLKSSNTANNTQEVLPATEQAQETTAETPNEQPIEAPETIRIPAINVSAPIESVGMDKNGAMDTPKVSDNVAWYNLGAKPGQKGSAVIAGHYDKKDGSPAVFWDLTKLKPGDEIITTDVNGVEKTFEVTHTEKFPLDKFPMQEVFGDSSESMLNLITCEGAWNASTGLYSHRTVVFSKLVE